MVSGVAARRTTVAAYTVPLPLARWVRVAPSPAAAPPAAAPCAGANPPAALDEITAIARLRGNRAAYERLLRRFHDTQAQAAAQIAEAWGRGEHEEAQRQAHTLKSVAATLGADALAGAAEAVELAIRQGRHGEVATLAQTLQTRLAELMPLLASRVPPPVG